MLAWQVYIRKDDGRIFDAVEVTTENIDLLKNYIWGREVTYSMCNFDVGVGDMYARSLAGYCFSYPKEYWDEYLEKVELKAEDLYLWRNIPIPWREKGRDVDSIIHESKQFCSLEGLLCPLAFVKYTNYCGASIYVEYHVGDGETIRCLNIETGRVTEVKKSTVELGEFYRDLTNTHIVYLASGETDVCVVPENVTQLICVGDVHVNGYIKTHGKYITVKGDSLVINNQDTDTPLIGNTDDSITSISVQTKNFKYYPENRNFWYKPIEGLLPVINIRS